MHAAACSVGMGVRVGSLGEVTELAQEAALSGAWRELDICVELKVQWELRTGLGKARVGGRRGTLRAAHALQGLSAVSPSPTQDPGSTPSKWFTRSHILAKFAKPRHFIFFSLKRALKVVTVQPWVHTCP